MQAVLTQQHLETLILGNPLVVAMSFDAGGKVSLWNQAAERFFGFSAQQARGRRIGNLLPVQQEGELCEEWIARVRQTRLPNGPREKHFTLAHGPAWLVMTLLPLCENGEVREVFFMGVDITDRVSMEAELRQHRDHLEAMVAAQTVDLLRAKETAEHANRSKSEFLANMSHELRTPMHAILSFARIGHFKVATAPQEKLKSYFEHIRAGGERLLDLVNDLLDLSKLEAGRMQYVMARLDLRRCAQGVVAELAPLFDGKQLVCQVEATADDCHVIADHKRMEQVLRNLLGNAIKFTPEGKCISVGIAPDVMPAGRRANDDGTLAALRLSIADEGIGIPEPELDSVFDKFTQSSLTSSGAGGTGLGLAICREIVHAHRGIIRATNRAGGGTVFDVLLPLPDKDFP
jgi:PAS domain S-box-containing protein